MYFTCSKTFSLIQCNPKLSNNQKYKIIISIIEGEHTIIDLFFFSIPTQYLYE